MLELKGYVDLRASSFDGLDVCGNKYGGGRLILVSHTILSRIDVHLEIPGLVERFSSRPIPINLTKIGRLSQCSIEANEGRKRGYVGMRV